MGWDADAIYNGQPFDYVDCARDPPAREAFAKAAAEAFAEGGTDSSLQDGSLDLSGAVSALARLSGEDNRAAVWNPAKVRAIQADISWPDIATLPEHSRAEYASAKAFLKACAEQGYGIQFDP